MVFDKTAPNDNTPATVPRAGPSTTTIRRVAKRKITMNRPMAPPPLGFERACAAADSLPRRAAEAGPREQEQLCRRTLIDLLLLRQQITNKITATTTYWDTVKAQRSCGLAGIAAGQDDAKDDAESERCEV